MNASILHSPPVRQEDTSEPRTQAGDAAWRPIYWASGVAALLMVVTIVAAIPILIVSPPPSAASVADWFALFHRSALLGLLDLDLLMLVAIGLSGLTYLALYGALRRVNRPVMALAAITGFLGIAAYFASNTAFNMLSLSNQYAAATTDAERSQLLAAGRATLAIWQGSAYDVGYILGGVAILLIALVMLRSAVFGKVTGYVGVVLGVTMLVPGTAGTIGLILSLLSLVPTALWEILIARRFFQLAASYAEAAHIQSAGYP